MAVSLIVLVIAAGMMWRAYRTRKEIYEFTERLEADLDKMTKGEAIESMDEETDSLSARVHEKLCRIQNTWEQKEGESREGKRKMKELISDISHQTRTPIANQKIYMEILKEDLKEADVWEQAGPSFKKLEQQTDKLDFLFQSLVKMSRLENGIIQIQKQRADLRRTLAGAVSAIVPAASKKGIFLRVEAEETVVVEHDVKWTEEAIYNLLDNAVKYTHEKGQVCIRILPGEIFTEIQVEDTGKGIAAERQAQIFTRFYREPEVHEQEGIGVGLYLTREIAAMQGGFVEVCSNEGEGALFRFCLPG